MRRNKKSSVWIFFCAFAVALLCSVSHFAFPTTNELTFFDLVFFFDLFVCLSPRSSQFFLCCKFVFVFVVVITIQNKKKTIWFLLWFSFLISVKRNGQRFFTIFILQMNPGKEFFVWCVNAMFFRILFNLCCCA